MLTGIQWKSLKMSHQYMIVHARLRLLQLRLKNKNEKKFYYDGNGT